MTVTLKLYASLAGYLPSEAKDNRLQIELDAPTSPNDLLTRHRVPEEMVHLVLINGVFIPPEKRGEPLSEGDELAVWPAIAGG